MTIIIFKITREQSLLADEAFLHVHYFKLFNHAMDILYIT